MALSLAALPKSVLIGAPIAGLGLLAAAFWYEFIYKKTPAAGSLAPVAAPTGPVIAPTGDGTTPVGPSSSSASASGPIMGATGPAPVTPGSVVSMVPRVASFGPNLATMLAPPSKGPPTIVLKPASPPPSSPPTGVLGQAQQSAQQLLAALPSPFPNDNSMGINEQVVRATLGQFISSPTFAQFNATLSALHQNTSAPAANAFNVLNRYMQTLQA